MAIDHIGPFLAFLAACILAAPVAGYHLWARSSGLKRPDSILPATALALVLVTGAALSVWHNQSGEHLGVLFGSETQDIGISEYGVVLALLGAAWLLILLARRAEGIDRVLFGLAALACFLVAGEELSWGQWIFGWGTPDALAEINLQNETNAHNLIDPRLYDLAYSAIGFVTLLTAIIAYVGFGRSGYQIGPFPLRMLRLLGQWLRDSQTGLVWMLAGGVLLQHELFEEYSEFVFAVAAFLYLKFALWATPRPVRSNREPAHV